MEEEDKDSYVDPKKERISLFEHYMDEHITSHTGISLNEALPTELKSPASRQS